MAATANKTAAQVSRRGRATRRTRSTAAAPIDRREELMAAARAAFVDKGVEATKVSDIVARAGLAQGTFYLYFDTKMAALLALSEQVTTAIYARGTAALVGADDFAAGMDAAVEASFAAAREHREMLSIMHYGPVLNEIRAQTGSIFRLFEAEIEGWVTGARDSGLLPPTANACLVATLAIAVMDAGIHAAYTNANPLTDDVVQRETAAFLKRAINLPG